MGLLLSYFAGADYAQYEKDDKNNEKNEEKYLCDAGGSSGNAGETKQPRDD
jgi:hypothetical protein